MRDHDTMAAPPCGLTGLDIPHRLRQAPRWMLILGGAAAMFLGQMLWALVAVWTMGPVPPGVPPMAGYSAGLQLLGGVVVMPFLETLVGQWLPMRTVRRLWTAPWWVAGLASVTVFTALHGYTDRFAINILLGAVVLAAIFAIEAQRDGRLVLSTWLTHALANLMVFGLQCL